MSELIISVSGLRGIVGETLTPEVASRYARAFAAGLPAGPIVITQDGRASGPMLAEALKAGLTAAGRDVLDAGVAATPTTGVLVRHLNAAGGIQISASHNPAEYNGLKLFSAEGRVIPATAGEQVIVRFRANPEPGASAPGGNLRGGEEALKTQNTPGADAPGSVQVVADTLSHHRDLVLALVDVKRIQAKNFHVLLDANHGSGSVLGQPLLEFLGCRVTLLGGTPDGQFAHTPEPTAENLAGVLTKVKAVGADVGFCTDPDADRLAVIDETGRYLGEEYTLSMCVDHVLRHDSPLATPRVASDAAKLVSLTSHPSPLTANHSPPGADASGSVITNCSTSRMSEDLAKKYHVPFFRSAVGEANVVDLMRAKNALLGGEGNGGVIEPRVGWVRDSFVGMAYLLDAMAARGLKISELADELPRYEIVKTKMTVARGKIPAALAALEKHFANATADKLDGLRLDWPGKWLLVRASNTEPVVRAIAEAGTAAEARRLCEEAAGVIGHI